MSDKSSGKNQSGGPPVPEPRRANNPSNASDAELRTEVDWYESLTMWAGAAVAAAVIFEVPLILWPLEEQGLQQLCEASATLVIGLGVAAEVVFGKRASRRQSELLLRSEERLAVALERTEYRSLKDSKLMEALSKWPPASLELKFTGDDPESFAFAMDFKEVFSSLGWKVCWYIESYGDIVPGIIVPDHHADASVAANVRAALTEAGIEFSTEPLLGFHSSNGPNGVPPVGPKAILYVGPKPPIPRP